MRVLEPSIKAQMVAQSRTVSSVAECDRLLALSETMIGATSNKQKKRGKVPPANPELAAAYAASINMRSTRTKTAWAAEALPRLAATGPPSRRVLQLQSTTTPEAVKERLEREAIAGARIAERRVKKQGEEEERLVKAKVKAKAMAKRKALLPCLEDLGYNDVLLEQSRTSLNASSTKFTDNEKRAKKLAFGDDDFVQSTWAVSSRVERRTLLDEPCDEAILATHSDRLMRLEAGRQEHFRKAALGLEVVVDTSSPTEDVVRRFSRFAECSRCDTASLFAFSAGWLTERLEEAFDALASELSRLNGERMRRAPEIVAEDMWRRFGAKTPAYALALGRGLLLVERTPEASLLARFLDESISEEAMVLALHARSLLERRYHLNLRHPRSRVADGSDGRFKCHILKRRDEAPRLTTHALFSSKEQSPLFDASILQVHLPARAVRILCQDLVGDDDAASKAQEDDLTARGRVAAKEKSRGYEAAAGPGEVEMDASKLSATLLTSLVCKFVVRKDAKLAYKAVSENSTEEEGCVELYSLLDALVTVAMKTPEDLVSLVKFADGGTRLAMLGQLQSAMEDSERADWVALEVKSLHSKARKAKALSEKAERCWEKLEYVKQQDRGKLLAARTQKLITEAHCAKAISQLRERRTELASLERSSDGTWTSLTTATAEIKVVSGPVFKALRLLRAAMARIVTSKRAAIVVHQEVTFDYALLLAPLVAKQEICIVILQEWARRVFAGHWERAAKIRTMQELSKVAVREHKKKVKNLTELEKEVAAELLKEKEAVARERDATRRCEVRAANEERDLKERRAQHSTLSKMQIREVNFRFKIQQRRRLRAHLEAWQEALMAHKFAMGFYARLLRSILKKWLGWTQVERKTRHAASLVSVHLILIPRAVAEMKKRRERSRKMVAAAHLVYGEKLQRLRVRIMRAWRQWAHEMASAGRMRAMLLKKFLLKVLKEWHEACVLLSLQRRNAGFCLTQFARQRMWLKERSSANLKIQCFARLISARNAVAERRSARFRRVEAQRLKREQRDNAALMRKRVFSRLSRSVFTAWRKFIKLKMLMNSMSTKQTSIRFFRIWREYALEQVQKRKETLEGREALAVALARGHVTRRKYGPELRRLHNAVQIQTMAIRPWLARERVVRVKLVLLSSTRIQSVTRGNASREATCLFNAASLLEFAYFNDVASMRKHQSAAVNVRSLMMTHAQVARHSTASSDSCLHRAARGFGAASVVYCLNELRLEANTKNSDKATALHVIGEPLYPPEDYLTPAEAAKARVEEERTRKILQEREAEEGFQPLYVLEERRRQQGSGGLNRRDRNAEKLVQNATEVKEAVLIPASLPVKRDRQWFRQWFAAEDFSENVLAVLEEQEHHSRGDVADSDDEGVSDIESEDEEGEALRPELWLIVTALCEMGAEMEAVDSHGRTPLICAIHRGDAALVALLLKRGADVEAAQYSGQTALSLSCRLGLLKVARLILKHGADVNGSGRKGRTPLHEACRLADRRCGPRLVRALLAQGANVNAETDDGLTPLALCCAATVEEHDSTVTEDPYGTSERLVLHLLLERGAKADALDGMGRSPLHLAAAANRADAIAICVDVGDAAVSLVADSGETPLHVAARTSSLTALRALLERGADVKIADGDGNQPVHVACRAGDVAAVELLVVKYESPLACRNWEGFTPIGITRLHGKAEVTSYLLRTMATSSLGLFEDDFADAETGQQLKEWDRPIAETAGKWRRELQFIEEQDEEGQLVNVSEEVVDFQLGSCVVWRHEETGEVRNEPPAETVENLQKLLVASWPKTVLKRQLHTQEEEEEVGADGYERERAAMREEIGELRTQHGCARTVQRTVRRWLAQQLAQWERERRNAARQIQRAARWSQWTEKTRKQDAHLQLALVTQRLFRGREARGNFYAFDYETLWWRRAERQLAVKLQRAWRGFVSRRFLRITRNMRAGPQTFDEWQKWLKEPLMEPARVFGIYEERYCPRRLAHPKDKKHYDDHMLAQKQKLNAKKRRGSLSNTVAPVINWRSVHLVLRDVKFYHNRLSGKCGWEMPGDWQQKEHEDYRQREELRKTGQTSAMHRAASLLQSNWLGQRQRRFMRASLEGARLMRCCEDAYLEDPKSLRKLAQYALYLHVYKNDVERAAKMYQQAMSRMDEIGPPDAWVLCSYAVFCAATATEDWPTIEHYAQLGRKAPGGPLSTTRKKDKSRRMLGYDVAEGFFRLATADDPQLGWSWHNYALARWLIFADRSKAEELFVTGVQVDGHDQVMQQNFDRFLDESNDGGPREAFEVVREHAQRRMFIEMKADRVRIANLRSQPRVQAAVMVIQTAWRRYCFWKQLRERTGERAPPPQPVMIIPDDVSSLFSDGDWLPDEQSSDIEEELASAFEISPKREGPLRWEEGEDVSGRRFWTDVTTNETTWIEPDDSDERIEMESSIVVVEDDGENPEVESDFEDQDDDDQDDDASVASEVAEESHPRREGWERHYDAAASAYFWYDPLTATSEWEEEEQ